MYMASLMAFSLNIFSFMLHPSRELPKFFLDFGQLCWLHLCFTNKRVRVINIGEEEEKGLKMDVDVNV